MTHQPPFKQHFRSSKKLFNFNTTTNKAEAGVTFMPGFVRAGEVLVQELWLWPQLHLHLKLALLCVLCSLIDYQILEKHGQTYLKHLLQHRLKRRIRSSWPRTGSHSDGAENVRVDVVNHHGIRTRALRAARAIPKGQLLVSTAAEHVMRAADVSGRPGEEIQRARNCFFLQKVHHVEAKTDKTCHDVFPAADKM